jgi:hypothetical protein
MPGFQWTIDTVWYHDSEAGPIPNVGAPLLRQSTKMGPHSSTFTKLIFPTLCFAFIWHNFYTS